MSGCGPLCQILQRERMSACRGKAEVADARSKRRLLTHLYGPAARCKSDVRDVRHGDVLLVLLSPSKPVKGRSTAGPSHSPMQEIAVLP